MRAVLFDLDGTLVHSIPFHVKAWLELCSRHGLKVHRERFENEFSGMKNDEIIPRILDRAVAAEELAQLTEEKESLYREFFKADLKALPGVVDFLELLASRDVPCAVASAAPFENREFVLNGLDLTRFFRAVVGGEHAKRGKPSPDIFLLAAQALGRSPSDCVVFEDAVNGVKAAQAAGMPCVAITTTSPALELRNAGADVVISSYRELPDAVFEMIGISR
jgi:beta-phosphoglucomutase